MAASNIAWTRQPWRDASVEEVECCFRLLKTEGTRRTLVTPMGTEPVSGWESVLSQGPKEKTQLSLNLQPPDQVKLRFGDGASELTGVGRISGVRLGLRPHPLDGIAGVRQVDILNFLP